jgi:hypothetical protein
MGETPFSPEPSVCLAEGATSRGGGAWDGRIVPLPRLRRIDLEASSSSESVPSKCHRDHACLVGLEANEHETMEAGQAASVGMTSLTSPGLSAPASSRAASMATVIIWLRKRDGATIRNGPVWIAYAHVMRPVLYPCARYLRHECGRRD